MATNSILQNVHEGAIIQDRTTHWLEILFLKGAHHAAPPPSDLAAMQDYMLRPCGPSFFTGSGSEVLKHSFVVLGQLRCSLRQGCNGCFLPLLTNPCRSGAEAENGRWRTF
eukprot:12311553-Karenia_brevis.AAC.1